MALPGYSRPVLRVREYLALLEVKRKGPAGAAPVKRLYITEAP